jgi:hypothetical protein
VFFIKPDKVHQHLYEVPELDYTGEDIDLEFMLVAK